jgi:hypothetical protein
MSIYVANSHVTFTCRAACLAQEMIYMLTLLGYHFRDGVWHNGTYSVTFDDNSATIMTSFTVNRVMLSKSLTPNEVVLAILTFLRLAGRSLTYRTPFTEKATGHIVSPTISHDEIIDQVQKRWGDHPITDITYENEAHEVIPVVRAK